MQGWDVCNYIIRIGLKVNILLGSTRTLLIHSKSIRLGLSPTSTDPTLLTPFLSLPFPIPGDWGECRQTADTRLRAFFSLMYP